MALPVFELCGMACPSHFVIPDPIGTPAARSPARKGILRSADASHWIPAFAGMTGRVGAKAIGSIKALIAPPPFP